MVVLINVEKAFGKFCQLFIIQNKATQNIWNRRELKADN